MKSLIRWFLKKKEYFFAFVLFFFLSFPYVTDICSGYLNFYNFDLQEFLLWNYSSINGVTPYRDIFYPYGLLSYYKNYNLSISLAFYSVMPILFLIIFLAFKKIFKDKFTLYSSIMIFYLFVVNLTGLQIFSRYGLLMAFSLLFAYVFYKKINLSKKVLVYLGILLGLLLTLVGDQGAYLVLSFVLLFFFSKHLRSQKNILKISIELVFMIFGFLLGIIPFLAFLLNHGGINEYFNYFREVSEIAAVAKTPFFTFISSPANIFTISTLILAIFHSFIKLFLNKGNFSLLSFFQLSLIFVILIMEQKSIVRSIDRQIAFVSLALLMLITYEWINKFKKGCGRYIYVIFITAVAILYSFTVEHQRINFSSITQNYYLLINGKCYENNLSHSVKKNPSYVKIINALNDLGDFNKKIFSFPTGDSVLYILLNQSPPRYNSIFEGSSFSNQNLSIKYIQDNQIKYISLNVSPTSVQDAVPDYVRQGILFEYIINNYSPFALIENHLLLSKTEKKDFFASAILIQARGYENYLRSVHLSKIPYSEGHYKYNYLKKNSRLLIDGNSLTLINQFLEEGDLYSSNKVLVLIPDKNNSLPAQSSVRIMTENAGATTAYYDSCKTNQTCIIDLSRIPLLYGGRKITHIDTSKGFSGKIMLYEAKALDYLW